MAQLTKALATSPPNGVSSGSFMVAADVAGDSVKLDYLDMIVIFNGSVAPITVTFDTPNKVGVDNNVDIKNEEVTVPAGETWHGSRMAPAVFANLETGLCSWTYSDVTTVEVGVLKTR